VAALVAPHSIPSSRRLPLRRTALLSPQQALFQDLLNFKRYVPLAVKQRK
jgi:hypothetical protein